MKYLILLTIFTVNYSFGDTECENHITFDIIYNNQAIQNAVIDCTEQNSKKDSCNCLKDLTFPIQTSESLSSSTDKEFYSTYTEQVKKSVFYLANKLRSYTILPDFQPQDIVKECSFDQLTQLSCSTRVPLFNDTKEIQNLKTKLNNNLHNTYKKEGYLKPDFVNDRGCSIPDSVVSKIKLDVNLITFEAIRQLIKANSSQAQIKSHSNLNDLIEALLDSDDLNDESYDKLETLHTNFSANPIFSKILKDSESYEEIIGKKDTVEIISNQRFQENLIGDFKNQCATIKKELKKVQCIDKNELTIPFDKFKDIIVKNNPLKEDRISSNNSDLNLFCHKKGSLSESKDIFSNIYSELPPKYKSRQSLSLDSLVSSDYEKTILHQKIGDEFSNQSILSLCDYLPQPLVGKEYNSIGIKEALRVNCSKNNEYSSPCLQAEAIHKTYGPRLEEISELEEKITLIEKESGTARTIEFNGEVISITDARAKRELLVKNLFIEDQQPPKLIQDFIGEEAPKLATSKKTDSQSSKQKSSSQKESSNGSSTSSNSLKSSSRSIASVGSESSQPNNSFTQPISPSRSGPISQAQRDQNTKDFFNDISERFRKDRTASNQVQQNRNNGNNIASRNSRFSDFDRDILDQSTRHLPATASNISSDFDNSSDSFSSSNELGGPTFDEQRSRNTGEKVVVSDEKSFNDALGAKERAAEKRRTAPGQVGSSRRSGSTGRSPASSSAGGNSSGVPGSSGVNVNKGGTNEYGETTRPLIELNADLTGAEFTDIVELVQNDPTAKTELFELIESEEVRTFVIKQGEFEVLVTKKKNGYFSVRSEGNEADLSYRDFLAKIKTTFLTIKDKKLTKKDEILKELSGIKHTDTFSDLSNL